MNNLNCGIVIARHNFNVFCYADDILLFSLTSSGLQVLINYANNYIVEHGLRFNPAKTFCSTFGKNRFVNEPTWSLNNHTLSSVENLTCLGVNLSSNLKGKRHADERIRKCQRAFFSLQGVGFCKNGVNHDVKVKLWNSILAPILTYGNQCIDLSDSYVNKLDKLQNKLLKAAIGIPKFCRSTPVIHAIDVPKASNIIKCSQLDLMCQIFNNNSASRTFYSHLLNLYFNNEMSSIKGTLVSRVINYVRTDNFSFIKSIFDVKYCKNVKAHFKNVCINHGICDSVKSLLFINDLDSVYRLLLPF